MNSLVEIGTVVLEKMDFKRCQYILTIFAIVVPWKRALSIICKNLNSLHQMMLCGKFG